MITRRKTKEARELLEKPSTPHDSRDSLDSKGSKDLKDPKDSTSHILSSSVAGASALVFLQLCSRLLTFTLHQIVLRYTSAETLGFAAVKLELLLSTILFLSREGFRGALLRGGGDNVNSDRPNDKKAIQEREHQDMIPSTSPQFETQKITNLAYIPTAIGAFTTLAACAYFFSTIKPADAAQQPFLYTSIALYGLAAYAELLVEPLMILAMTNLYFRLRVSAEGAAVVLRCLITFGFTIYGARNVGEGGANRYGVLAFAMAQVAFALTLVAFYVVFFLGKVRGGEMEARNLVPQKLIDVGGRTEKAFYFDSYLLGLASTMTQQSLLKHILTEGDKMLIVRLSSDTDQGIYAFVVNYGSLIVRILFQPLEETSRTLFSKLLSDLPSPPTQLTPSQTSTLQISLTILTTLLKLHLLLGLLLTLAPPYTHTLIDILVGSRWSHSPAPTVLAHYCLYIPIMGLNGITEAFVQAVAPSKDLALLSRWMLAFSVGFAISGWFFMQSMSWGASGLIAANAVNLGMRIVWSAWYITRFYRARGVSARWSDWTPRWQVVTIMAAAGVIVRYSEAVFGWDTWGQKGQHVGVGVGVGVVVAAMTYRLEKEFFARLVKLMRARKDD